MASHAREGPAPNCGAVLHYQRTREGHGAGDIPGPELCRKTRRPCSLRLCLWSRHNRYAGVAIANATAERLWRNLKILHWHWSLTTMRCSAIGSAVRWLSGTGRPSLQPTEKML